MPVDLTMAANESEPGSAAHTLRALLRFFAMVRRRKAIVTTSVVVALLLGVLYAKTAIPVYEASCALLVQKTGEDSRTGYDGPSSTTMETYRQLCLSDLVLGEVAKKLKRVPPEVAAGTPHEQWPLALRELITATARRGSNIIELGCSSQSPVACTEVINAVIDSLQLLDEAGKSQSMELVKQLDDDRRDLEKELIKKEEELLKKQRSFGGIAIQDSETIHPLIQTVIELNLQLRTVRHERMRLDVLLPNMRAAVQQGADLTQFSQDLSLVLGEEVMHGAFGLSPRDAPHVASIPDQLVDQRAQLLSLQQSLGPAHPKIVELQQKIVAKQTHLDEARAAIVHGIRDQQLGYRLLQLVEDRLAIAWQREQALMNEYRQAENEAKDLNSQLAEKTIIERRISLERSVHESLLNRIANVKINADQAQVRVTVIRDPVQPHVPVFPSVRGILLRAGVGGLLVGFLCVYVLDLLDDRFRTPEELKDQLGVPVLAVVRQLPANNETGADAIQVHLSPNAIESEAFRTLRTTLAFSGEDRDRLAITSSEPGDGKTTVLSNLAVSYAQSGKRTIIIDADMRRPGLTKLFDMRGPGGLSEVLRSDNSIGEMCQAYVRPSGVEGLDVLSSGPKPSDPGELLTRARFADLIAWAESAYDQVLVDCPPILAASDAAIVGRRVDGILLVVQPERNHRRLVVRAAESLLSVAVPLIGVVANRVGETDGKGYGYGYGYGGYGYGYGHGEDEDEELDGTERPNRHSEVNSPRNLPRRAA